MNLVSLTAGKYFNLGKHCWVTTEGRLSYVKGEKVNFEQTESISGSIIIAASTTSNYNTTKENKSTIGTMFQADINWVLTSFMGAGAGVYANINSVQAPLDLILNYL